MLQSEQQRDQELVARAEAHTPQSMNGAMKKEWDATLARLRREAGYRLARSLKNEAAGKPLIAEMEALVHQYGTLSEQIRDVNERTKRTVPPSEALWFERGDTIKADIRQLDARQQEIATRDKELRGTDWERTRSDAIVTSSIDALEDIISRARTLTGAQGPPVFLQEGGEERQRRRASREQEAQHQKAEAAAQAPFLAFLRKHGATDMSDWNASYKLSVNPFSYQGKRVFLSGRYHKNISRHEAIVTILPDIVVWQTARNLADGSPLVRCVVKVLGTTSVRQGMIERDVPHVQEIECLQE